MLAEWETNTVLIADHLRKRYPEMVRQLESIFTEHQIPLIAVSGLADIWIRDAAPVQVDDRRFTQFCYRPDYLRKNHRHLITRPAVFRKLEFVGRPTKSQLIIDGGNIVGTGSVAVLTDKVLKENPRWNRNELSENLRKLLQVENVFFVPREPYDYVGHTDAMLRFLTYEQVILNDYSLNEPRFAERLEKVLTANGIRFTRIPYMPEHKVRDGIPSAVGNYANYLRVENLVVVPAYELPEDEIARGILANLLPQCCVVSLPCRDLAEQGGVINCATWTIRRP